MHEAEEEAVEVECELVVEIDDVEDLMHGKADPMSPNRMPKVSQSVRTVPMDETADEANTSGVNTSGATTSNESGVKGDTSVKADTDVVTRPLALILT